MLTDTFVGTLTHFELSTVKISTDAKPDHVDIVTSVPDHADILTSVPHHADIVTSMADHTDILTPVAEYAYLVASIVVNQVDNVS